MTTFAISCILLLPFGDINRLWCFCIHSYVRLFGLHECFFPGISPVKVVKLQAHCIFGLFCCKEVFFRTAWQPYGLSHIHALRINLSYKPKNQSLKCFGKKYWELTVLKISFFFELAILNFFFQKNLFLLHPYKN